MSNNDVSRRGSHLAFSTSLMTTLAVAVAPSFVAFGFLVWSRPDPHPVLATIVSIIATIGAFVLGARVWENQPESFGYSFADVMLWHWVRREWAEEKLVRNARLLGYDREGRFVGKVEISPERQLRAAREIGAALDSKSSYTLNHSKRVEAHARDIAAVLGLSAEQTEELATAAALHDIGNIRIPEHVIRKAGELTLEERSTIEGHVLLGAIMAFEAGGESVVAGVRHHHERWDGKGYPNGLKGEEIPLFARIIGIAEAYDAMTSTRPYRQSLTQDQALAVLREEGNCQFDQRLVEVFAATLPEPLQIVERIPALAWAQRQVRELTILFRRVGGTAISAAASTLAIALILGTALLKPDAFPGIDGGPQARPERHLAADPSHGSGTERIALASQAEGYVAGESVIVGEELAAAGGGFVDDVEVLGERITIEGEPGSHGETSGGTGHGGSSGGGHGGSGHDGHGTDAPGTDVPGTGTGGGSETVVDDSRGGGETPGGSTNPDPTTNEPGHPGNGHGPGHGGNGHGNGHGNGAGNGGNGHGRGGSGGNGHGRPGGGSGGGHAHGHDNDHGNGGANNGGHNGSGLGQGSSGEHGNGGNSGGSGQGGNQGNAGGNSSDHDNNGGGTGSPGNPGHSDPGNSGEPGNEGNSGNDAAGDGWAESGNNGNGTDSGSGGNDPSGNAGGSSNSDDNGNGSSNGNGSDNGSANGNSNDNGNGSSSGGGDPNGNGGSSSSNPGNGGGSPGASSSSSSSPGGKASAE